ncbi:eukaryotic translation initiation factor 3 subunit A [Thraustotheca clavata]|uniref:Eukaryotic translation initiation factor 3 subunit A n=1 Tax=Thraustotheca clavata TaxID=74557 RepID=A0A1V9ZN39_9STRA|nr:eukaryotic translation initiation factor 3 subunit A [Thraustotheca clavata]
MSHFFQKPENALKRANELLNTPNVDAGVMKRQKRSALEILHEALIAKKNRTWQPTHEELMITYLSITIDLQLGRIAKDGLHQYRNLVLAQNPASLEKVLLYFVNESEKRAAEARAHSTEINLNASVDLEAVASPEAMMLSTTTAEDSHDRNDRAVLVPWLRFMWETYRTVLDILRCNTKLEALYKRVSLSAFAFCKTYTRKIEFRRLCEILRTHLYTMQRHESAPTTQSIRQMRGWDGWSSDSIELHLQVRFEQLDAATSLELWTEAFRTIDDVHLILSFLETAPKPALMATFYHKLAEIFYISQNHVYHAFAWFKYITLIQRENIAPVFDIQVLASKVVLASLSIPLQSNNVALLENADNAAVLLEEKDEHMAALLGFTQLTPPTRSQLLDDMQSLHIVDAALPCVAALYQILERSPVDPLQIASAVAPHVAALKADASLAKYAPAVEQLAVHHILDQLTEVYASVTVEHLHQITAGLNMSANEMEQWIVRAQSTREQSSTRIRIDHRANCVRFSQTLALEGQAKQMTLLGQKLQACVGQLPSTESPRKELFATARSNAKSSHEAMLERKVRIEAQKEAFERLMEEKAKTEEKKRLEAEQLRQKQEVERLAAEARRREEEKARKIEEDIKRKEIEKTLKKLGEDTADIDLDKVDHEKLLAEAKEKALKAKEEAQRKLKEAARRLDYIVRATREAELPILQKMVDAKEKEERDAHEASFAATLKASQEEHALGLVQKELLKKYQDACKDFCKGHIARQSKKFQAIVEERKLRANVDALTQTIQRAKDRKFEYKEKLRREAEEEAHRQAEEERLERERRAEEERQAEREAERRRREEAEEARRQEEAKQANRYVPPSRRSEPKDEEGWSSVRGGNRRMDDAFKNSDRDIGSRSSRFGRDEQPRSSWRDSRDAAPRDAPPRFVRNFDREGGDSESRDNRPSSGSREGSSRFNRDEPRRFDRESSGRFDRDDSRGGFVSREGSSRFGGDREGSSRFGGDRESSSRYGGDREGSNRFGGDREGSSRFGGDREGSNRFGGDREGSSRFGGDRDGQGRFGGDREGSNRFGGDRDGQGRFGGDREGSSRFGGDRDGQGRFGGNRRDDGPSRDAPGREGSFRRDSGARAPDSKWR